MDSVCLVVSRYKEDVKWLDDLSYNIIVYNKGNTLNSTKNMIVHNNIPNVGREAYGYLKHIVDNYDRLHEITVFLQGNIIDHIHTFARVDKMTSFYRHTVDESIFVKDIIEEARVHGSSTKTSYECNDTGYDYGLDYWYTSVTPSSIRPFGCWFEEVFGYQLPRPLIWIPGALFAVRKDRIERWPISFYERLLEMVSSSVNPEDVYFLERSWYYMWN